MSRKSRQRQKLEIVPDDQGTDLPDEARAAVYRLTGKLHDMLEAIVSGCALNAQTPEPDDELYREDLLDEELEDEELDGEELYADEPTEEEIEAGVTEFMEAYGSVALTTRVLARELLAQTLGRRPAQLGTSLLPTESADDDSVAEALDKLVESLLPANLPGTIRPSRQARREAFDEAAWLVREVGLEEFDVSCYLSPSPSPSPSAGGTPELVARSLSPESAHVQLLEYLFTRAEGVAANLDPFLAVERDASFWEFSQWNVSPPPGRASLEVTELAAGVREQEYSLAERRTVTLGMSVMSELARDEEGFGELFPRQHRLAAALAASFVDVFECVGLEGTRATFRSMRDGRTFDVHEHTESTRYAPGWIAMGRLLPFDGDLHLRSPGMLFIEPADWPGMRAAVDAFADARPISPALALEVFISADVFGVPVPRSVKPARSKADARALLAMIDDILYEAELEREGGRNDVIGVRDEVYYTPGLHTDTGAAGDGGIRLDATLQAFMAALEEQAAGGSPERHQRARRKKRKGKRRR